MASFWINNKFCLLKLAEIFEKEYPNKIIFKNNSN